MGATMMRQTPPSPGRPLGKADLVVLAAALISFFLSVYLWFTGHRDEGLFVGLWVPSILGFATFVKLQLPRR
jgi:hypothetical protein